MSLGIWARKTMALGLAATLAGPSVSLLAAQEQSESQEEKKARRQQQAEKEQQKEQERQQEQAQRQAEREERAARQKEKAQQEQEQRQQEREQREQRSQERAQQAEQERAARQAEQAQRREQAEETRRQQEAERQRTDQAQRDVERRQRRAEQARVEEEARAAEQARLAEQARAAEQARLAQERAQQAQREAMERSRGSRGVDARSRQPVPGGNASVRSGEWISERQRTDIIRENRERSESFARSWTDRERLARQRAAQVQRQRRNAYYRYQQHYVDRLSNQWRYDDWRSYDYHNDPYFWSPPVYRYRYGGQYYQINDYAADLLRDAVNRGYEEGFLAGQADREDRWRGDYRDSYVYEDASYGYRGLYVDQRQYAYYFREGFDRGYADGYNSRYQYGYRDDDDHGALKVLAAVLAGILVFEAIH